MLGAVVVRERHRAERLLELHRDERFVPNRDRLVDEVAHHEVQDDLFDRDALGETERVRAIGEARGPARRSLDPAVDDAVDHVADARRAVVAVVVVLVFAVLGLRVLVEALLDLELLGGGEIELLNLDGAARLRIFGARLADRLDGEPVVLPPLEELRNQRGIAERERSVVVDHVRAPVDVLRPAWRADVHAGLRRGARRITNPDRVVTELEERLFADATPSVGREREDGDGEPRSGFASRSKRTEPARRWRAGPHHPGRRTVRRRNAADGGLRFGLAHERPRRKNGCREHRDEEEERAEPGPIQTARRLNR